MTAALASQAQLVSATSTWGLTGWSTPRGSAAVSKAEPTPLGLDGPAATTAGADAASEACDGGGGDHVAASAEEPMVGTF